MKQIVKKKDFNKKPSIDDIMAAAGMTAKTETDYSISCADKPMEFIPMLLALE